MNDRLFRQNIRFHQTLKLNVEITEAQTPATRNHGFDFRKKHFNLDSVSTMKLS